MLNHKNRFLKCKIERIDSDIAIISVKQADETPIYGSVPVKFLKIILSDPRFTTVKIKVLREFSGKLFIEWPAECLCPENCPGDRFWISKKFLI